MLRRTKRFIIHHQLVNWKRKKVEMANKTLFFFALLVYATAMAGFTESPTSQNISVGQEAEFRCRHSSADIIRWRVNGSLVSLSNHPDGVGLSLVGILTIVGRLDYNGTVVECVARFDNGSPEQVSDPALLIVTGTTATTPPTTAPPATAPPATMPPTPVEEGFTEDPSSLNVTLGKRVQFHCVHPASFTVVWTINGTMLTPDNFPPGVSFSSTFLGNDGFRHTLIIDAILQYDNTALACALFTDKSVKSEDALLRVQGPLDTPEVPDCSRNYATNTTTITWAPPPSIDLTNVEPDIVYCIEVQNITRGERGDVIVSECGITEPVYQSRDIPLNYIYNITVTPMSNVEGALNGTPAYTEEKFPILSQITSVFQRGNGKVNVTVTMDITEHRSKPLPSTYSLSLAEMNTNNPTLNATVKTGRSDSIVLDLVGGLKVGELLDCIVVAYRYDDHPLTNRSVLSTHLIQDISFPPPAPGELIVTGNFLNSSTTTGLLVIAYTSSSNVRYHLYPRTPNEQNFMTVINNLAAGDYHVSVFTVENGLPLRDVATLPQRVNVTSTENTAIQTTIDYQLQSTSTGVCITCTFLESSTATDCVAVVHQRISQLINSSAGLMNIESSHKFARSGDTAFGCIERVNLEDYQVGVLQEVLEPTVTANNVSTITVAASVFTALILLVVIMLVVVIFMKRYLRTSKLRHRHDVEVSMNSYESVSAKPNCIASDGEDNTTTESAPPSYDSVTSISTPTNDRSTEEDEVNAGDATYSVPNSLRPAVDIKHEKVNGEEYALVNKPAKAMDTSMDEAGQGTLNYAKPDVKPQGFSVPLDDDRVEYAEVNKTEGTKGQQYEIVLHPTSKPIMVVDDTSKPDFGYSEIRHQQHDCTEVSEDKPKPVTLEERPPPLPTRCTVGTLFPLLRSLSSEWKELGKALSLDEDHIDEIFTNNVTDEACLQVVVERYFMNNDFKHTWKEIVSVLREMKFEQVADKIYSLHVYPYEVLLPGEAQPEMTIVDKDCHDDSLQDTFSIAVDEENDVHWPSVPVQPSSTDLLPQAVFVHNSSNNPTPLRRPNADSKALSHLDHKEVDDATDRTHGETKVNNGGMFCEMRKFIKQYSKPASFEVKYEKLSDMPADENRLVTLSSTVSIHRSQAVLQGRPCNIRGIKKLFKANTTECNEDASEKSVLVEDQSQGQMNKRNKRCFERSLDTVRNMPVIITR